MPPVEVETAVVSIVPFVLVTKLIEFTWSICVRSAVPYEPKESATPLASVTECAVEEAVSSALTKLLVSAFWSVAIVAAERKQLLSSAMQPLVRLMPFAKVEVERLVTLSCPLTLRLVAVRAIGAPHWKTTPYMVMALLLCVRMRYFMEVPEG